MQKLCFGRQFRQFLELLFEIILNGLDVVISNRFDFFDVFCLILVEIKDQSFEKCFLNNSTSLGRVGSPPSLMRRRSGN